MANFLSPDWLKLKILDCGLSTAVKGAMKNNDNSGVRVYSKKNVH